MREIFSSYRVNRAQKTEKLLIGSLPEQERKDQETVLPSLQSPSVTPERQAPLAEQKRQKKHRIHFVALALVLLFSCLCIVSLVSQQPLARATAHSSSATLHHAASRGLLDAPTSVVDCLVQDCLGQLPATPSSWGSFEFAVGDNCKDHYDTATGDDFCESDGDFQWGNRDVTCIKAQKPENLKWPVGTTTGIAQATPGTSSGPQSTLLNNQNTCTTNSICYSDNRSGNDDSGQIHDLINGDEIFCFNKACISQGGDSTHANCGGLGYDKFGCAPIPQADGYFYNPTAYNPFAAFIQANANLTLDGKNGSVETSASNDNPTCDATNRKWTCPGGDTIYLALTLASGTFANPFTGSPKEISSTISQDVTTSSASGGGQGGGVTNQTETSKEPEYEVGCYAQKGTSWVFPCSDSQSGKINELVLKDDWLSGNSGFAGGTEKHPGHLSVTYTDETYSQTNLLTLYSLTLGFGFTLTIPAIILIGYQLLWSSWTLGRVASMEMFARLLLSFLAVGMSYELTTMLIGLSNVVSQGVVSLHASLGYPDVKLNGNNLTYKLDGESDPSSFRGIVIPLSRWGCVMNDFVDILAQKAVTDLLGFIPFVGGLIKFSKGISDAVQALKHVGEFIALLLSINLAVQVFLRVVLVNYYILTAPVAFGCWGLPGGFGQRVVGQWFKGFCSILFTQGVQLFVLTTLPLLLPSFPQLPVDTFGIFTIILTQLPRIIILMAVIKVPNMMGTQATKAIAQAGTVSSGAVAALGAAAYQVV